MRDASLVVIEYGGSWPRWLDPSQRATGDVAVVAQHYEGEPMSLVTQVANRITRLDAGGWALQTIILATNDRTDADAMAARAVLARGLIARMASVQADRFVLSVDPALQRRARHSLGLLSGQLADEGAGSGVSVVVRTGHYETVATRASAG